MSDYEIRSQEGLGDINDKLLKLTNACFGEYDGVIAASLDFQRWYTKRPGMSPRSCFVAMHGDEIVSNVYVTVSRVRLGGEMLGVGLIDTVMTHPRHRRCGLARALVNRAIEFMRDEGLDASMLYTVPNSAGYKLYSSLGFVDLVRVRYYKLTSRDAPSRSSAELALRKCGTNETRDLRNFLETAFEAYDGFPELTDELWRWRREERPDCLPVQIWLSRDETEIRATATLATAPLRFGNKQILMTGVLDFAVAAADEALPFLCSVLRKARRDSPIVILSAETNGDFNAMCESLGFRNVTEDVAMVKPLNARGEKCLRTKPRLWYTVTESLIGI